MHFRIGIILLLLPWTFANHLPNPEEAGGYFEGDLELTREQQKELLFQSRNGIKSEKYRWPGKTILYKISKDFGKYLEKKSKMQNT